MTGPILHSTSPDGRHTLYFDGRETGPGHWIDIPMLYLTGTETPVFLPGYPWHMATAEWSETGDQLSLHLMQYPGRRPPIDVTLDLAKQTAVARHWKVQKAETGRGLMQVPEGKVVEGTIADIVGYLQGLF
jgi:hypothetical protein